MKIVTVVGARPQFVKAACVSREISRRSGIREILVHTGQHFDANMSDVFFEEMEIPRPHYHLDVHSMNHGAMTGRMLEKIESVLLEEDPEVVLVYGDTNSTLAGALAARKLHINVVHVEAGLRSFNMRMPEEVNRVLTDRISDLLCCPTQTAVENLDREGFSHLPCVVSRTGDVMQDAALYYSRLSADRSSVLSDLGLVGKAFALCTVHRAENTDDPVRLANIVEALNSISAMLEVVVPLHPRTAKVLAASGLNTFFKVIPPVGYFDMIELLKASQIVLTDSGGLQKEAFFFESPCVTLRDETEWVELIESGVNVLAGASKEKIVSCFNLMMHRAVDATLDLYGGGQAAVNVVNEVLSLKSTPG
ncbi:MAG: UDP-N-acetylglucosamine 2-epimerase (non-hydrolyzing) [Desulfuromonadales bacterium]|nr:UDP-N-acetylglucosamine 2-epimerase (non-hydrolyzing) [Desulfuromonadales bacterium]MDW7756252.1 UDP-N-acetylglucosamine 2-epimerase (non-hydrolyzing) [Desulfuromonadales bacterium]